MGKRDKVRARAARRRAHAMLVGGLALALSSAGVGCAGEKTGQSDDDNVTQLPPGTRSVRTPESQLEREKRYCVPPSIMMHSRDVARLTEKSKGLLTWLEAHDYTTISYRDYHEILRGKKERPRRAIILSLDDVPTDWIRREFIQMGDAAVARSMKISLAVNPRAPYDSPNPNHTYYWDLIRTWAGAGLTAESHTVDHLNLNAVSDPVAEQQVLWAAERLTMGMEGAYPSDGQVPDQDGGVDANGGAAGDGGLDDASRADGGAPPNAIDSGALAESVDAGPDGSATRPDASLGHPRELGPLTSGAVALITPFGNPEVATERYPLIRRLSEQAGHTFIVGIPRGRILRPLATAEGYDHFRFPVFVGRVEIQEGIESTAWEIEHWYRTNRPPRDEEAIKSAMQSSGDIDREIDVIGGDLHEGDCRLIAEEYEAPAE